MAEQVPAVMRTIGRSRPALVRDTAGLVEFTERLARGRARASPGDDEPVGPITVEVTDGGVGLTGQAGRRTGSGPVSRWERSARRGGTMEIDDNGPGRRVRVQVHRGTAGS